MRTIRRTLALLAAAGILHCVLAPPALAGRARPIFLKFPRFEVPPNSDREVCTFVKLPRTGAYDARGTLIVNLGGNAHFASHHFLLYAYTGTQLAEFEQLQGKVVTSKACLDFGPTDRNSRHLIGGAQTRRSLQILPPGLAQQIHPAATASGRPALGLILNSHWINGSDRPQHAAVKIKIIPAKPHTVKRYLDLIFEVVANGFIKVPPGEVRDNAYWRWGPGVPDFGARRFGGIQMPDGPACVVSVTSHTHKRGKLFTVDFVDESTGASQHILRTLDYADPRQAIFDGRNGNPPPLLVMPGQYLEYRCTHDNGVTTPVKLGCEETPGVPPGEDAATTVLSHRGLTGAAKRCTSVGPAPGECPPTDPAYPGRTFTGNCVAANLVFGFTSDDEMCILPGSYYPVNPAAPPGQECDLGPLPFVN